MRRFATMTVVLSVWVFHEACSVAGEAQEKGPAAIVSTENGNKLVVNAKSVTYNVEKRVAVFEKDVSVTDSQVAMDAQKITVYLTDTNSVLKVEAEGDVNIRELGTAKKATAGKAVYDVVDDTVVLTENPQLEDREQGFYTTGAEKITYFRKDQEFKAEGDNVHLEFGIPESKTKGTGDFFRAPGTRKEETTAQ